ncbi:hypothetical protein [Ciceribacter sp. L1K22]|uniref:hypothetical protein n=1 Tax=Ciceribacter sp. L1K22 TaxID=2820275 RepID=UPI001ABE49A0|nr:hypothetical protein [Ciceribacter sp. L1K22]MBO3758639.1 hypothetical protein [Ciceribacter sp. L1K22]
MDHFLLPACRGRDWNANLKRVVNGGDAGNGRLFRELSLFTAFAENAGRQVDGSHIYI